MTIEQITINTFDPYTVSIGNNIIYSNILLDECSKVINQGFCKLVIIVDQNLPSKYHAQLQDFLILSISKKFANVTVDLLQILISESQKDRHTKEQIENKLFELNCSRKSCIIAIGGGVLLDMAGFIAATYNRGVPIIYLPTTLLAMVDASVGGKTGINTVYGKNLIGIIKQPQAVLIDIATLATLSEYQYLSALAEIIKVAIMFDKRLFDLLLLHQDRILAREPQLLSDLVFASVKIKKHVVEQDEFENGMRELLNFGHTIGHAIEQHEAYSISHGFAVALGISIEAQIANQMGVLDDANLQQIQNLLQTYFHHKIILSEIQENKLSQFLLFDKKSKSHQVHYVLVKEVGGFYTKDNKYSFPITPEIESNIVNLLQANLLFSYNNNSTGTDYARL